MNSPEIDSFLSSTCYTNPSEIKKLKFIYNSIKLYSQENDIAIKDLLILEVACGKGGITLPLASLGCQVKAFDINADSIKHIQMKHIKNLDVILDNAYTFNDGTKYDIVIASEVIEHFEKPEIFVENVKKSLHDNSYLIITTPNGYGPWELSNRIAFYRISRSNIMRRIFNKPQYVKIAGYEHRQFYTMKRVINLFCGMRLVKFGKSDSLLAAFPLKLSPICKIDVKLAEVLPYWLASGWYFIFNKTKNL